MTIAYVQAKERRRAVRISAAGALTVQHVGIESGLPVLDISLEGFALESPVPFVIGTRQQFHFKANDDKPTCVDAVVAHCVRIGGLTSERYVAGFAFVAESTSQRASVTKVLNAIAIARHKTRG